MMARSGMRGFWLAICLALSFGSAFCQPIDPQPRAIPPGRQIAFKVLMDGADIGRHSLQFEQQGENLAVEVRINFLVRFLNIPIYRYNHVNREIWSKDRKLLSLESQTDDDGRQEMARVERRGDRLFIRGSQNEMDVPANWLSSSYWNADLIHQTRLIDSRNGQIFNISVTPNGPDLVSVDDKPVVATRYDLNGDLQLSVWYDKKGEWVKMAFDHKGRHFDYVRIAPETISAANP